LTSSRPSMEAHYKGPPRSCKYFFHFYHTTLPLCFVGRRTPSNQ